MAAGFFQWESPERSRDQESTRALCFVDGDATVFGCRLVVATVLKEIHMLAALPRSIYECPYIPCFLLAAIRKPSERMRAGLEAVMPEVAFWEHGERQLLAVHFATSVGTY